MTDQPGGYPPPHQGGQPGNFPPPQGQPGGYPPPGGYEPTPGAYEPQPGGYPPPQGGQGFPPPYPGGQPGAYPPPPSASGGWAPPPPGYGMPPAYSIGDAFSWAWNKFSKNAGVLIVPTLLYALILGALGFLFFAVPAMSMGTAVTSYSDEYDYGYSSSASFELPVGAMVIMFLGVIVMMVAVAAMMSAYLGGIVDIADGKPVTVGTFFKPRSLGAVILATVLIGIASMIGSLVIIGSVVVSIFALYATIAVVDRNLSGVDGIKASFDVVKNRFGDSLLTWLVINIITTVGAFLCGVGLLVAGPVAALMLVYAWRRLTGAQVAPLTQ